MKDYISFNVSWESEFGNFVSEKVKVQNLNINQLKLQVHDSYRKDEKKTTDFEPTDNSDVANKGYLNGKLLKINSHLPLLEKDYNEFILQHNKQSEEEILIQRAVKTAIRILYDKAFLIIFKMLIRF